MRVTAGHETLWSKPRRAQRRRRCDGHLTEPHEIEAGALYVVGAIPPNSEYGNMGWWRMSFCIERCAPEECVPEPHDSGREDKR